MPAVPQASIHCGVGSVNCGTVRVRPLGKVALGGDIREHVMRAFIAILCIFALGVMKPALAGERQLLGYGRIVNNDYLGDGYDRGHTGDVSSSRIKGIAWNGVLPEKVGDIIEYRISAGIIALRPNCDGHITGYQGIEEIQQSFGEQVIDFHLPSPGTPTQGVDAGYMANAWIRMRHPDYDSLRANLNTVGETVKVLAE